MADNKKSSIRKGSSIYLLNLKQADKTAKRLKLSFQRTAAVLSLAKSGRSIEASVGILDISETGAGIFTAELLNKGSSVELTLAEPINLKIKGLIAWSIPVVSGVHGSRFRCRSGVQFQFDNDEQKTIVKDFLTRVAEDPMELFRQQPPALVPVDAPLVEPPAAAAPAAPDAPVPTEQVAAVIPADGISAAPDAGVVSSANPPTESSAPVAEVPAPTVSPEANVASSEPTAAPAEPAVAPVEATPAAVVAEGEAVPPKPEDGSGGQSQAA